MSRKQRQKRQAVKAKRSRTISQFRASEVGGGKYFDESHTVAEWRQYWEEKKHLDPTRADAIRGTSKEDEMVLDERAFSVYLNRKRLRNMVIEDPNDNERTGGNLGKTLRVLNEIQNGGIGDVFKRLRETGDI